MQSITPEQRKNAENQIKALRKEIDYDTRDYAIEDLNNIKEQTTLFLKGILDGMKEYFDNKLYLSSN